MFESGIRGGYSGVLGKRYVHGTCCADVEDFDPNKPQNYLLYLDANNLYGWAMAQPLPTGDFKREDLNYDWRNPLKDRGYILECDLEYS